MRSRAGLYTNNTMDVNKHKTTQRTYTDSDVIFVWGSTIGSTYLLEWKDFKRCETALHNYAWGLWAYGAVVLIAVCVFYVISIKSALRHWRECFTNVATVLAVYPIVAAAGFLVIVLPRFRLIAEAIAQEAVMIAMYHLFCLMVWECGGVDQLIRRAPVTRLETRVLPCCCWPCCVIPRPKLEKRNLTWVRYVILQMPFIQALIYVIVLALWAEDMMLYHRYFTYLQPFVAASILSGVWGMIMCVRLLESAGHKPKARFLVLQIVLIIVKVQCGFAKVLPEIITIRCITSLHPAVFVNIIQYSIMMLEMLLLSIWAWRLYRLPPGKDVEKIPRVMIAVLEDSVKSTEGRTPTGVVNKSYTGRSE